MDVDLRKLRYFLAVADLLNFGRAAERLHIAQPALSRQIRSLEHDLGVTLFDRDRHRVELTAAGRQLLVDAPGLLAAAARTRRRVSAAGRAARSLTVGFRAGIIVTDAVRAFSRAHPDAAVDLRHLEWDRQEQPVIDGRVDVAFLRPPVADSGLTVSVLYREPRVAVLPTDHRLARRATVKVADLVDELLLPAPGIAVPRFASRSHPTAVRTVEEKWEHVAAGNGVLFVAQSMARYYRRDDIVCIPLSDAPPDDVLLATAAGRASPLAEAFIHAARAAAARQDNASNHRTAPA